MTQTDSLLQLRKFVAPEYVFGPGAIDLVGQYAVNLGMENVLLVTDPGLIQAGWAEKVKSNLRAADLEVTVFSDVSPNPRDTEVMRGADVYAAKGCDGLVAVGGGSPMDCAKGIGIVNTNNRHILDFEGVDQVPIPGPPLACVPTTSGSSADVSQFSIIKNTNTDIKIAIVSKTVVPDASIIDPVLTTTMSRELTICTGLDALTHAMEAYVSNASSPSTDLFALEAIRLLSENLALVAEKPDDITLRSLVMLGSLYAGLAFSNAILGAVHAMAHSLGGLLDLPHGQCNAILLDHVMRYNFDSAPDRYLEIGRAMGAEITNDAPMAEKKEAALQAVCELKRALGMTIGLAQVGVTPEVLDKLARAAAADPCMATNPRNPKDIEEIKSIYEQAL